MLRPYIRIRRGGPSETDQVTSLKAAGVDMGEHAPMYADGLTILGKRRPKLDQADPLPQRTWAIRHLRRGDVLVIHDEATLGLSLADVMAQAAAVGLRGASVLVASTGQTYRWHPDAAAIGAFASRGGEQLRREATASGRAKAAERGFVGGRKPKLADPAIRARALELWGDSSIPSEQAVADQLLAEFGLKISPRTIRNALEIGREDARSGRAPKKKGKRAK